MRRFCAILLVVFGVAQAVSPHIPKRADGSAMTIEEYVSLPDPLFKWNVTTVEKHPGYKLKFKFKYSITVQH
jgi:hypothetical protein